MNAKSLSPVPRFISFCYDRKDGGNIGSCGNTEKEEENVEGEVTFCPWESKKDEANPYKSRDNRSFITPNRGKTTCEQQGEAVTNRKGGEESTCLPMGDGKAVFDQREEWRENGSGGKVKEPEAKEDEERKKLHLFVPSFFPIGHRARHSKQ